ncbi:MAG: hypothetical protein J2O47_07730, partial [Acidimicrobiaceae bacterium]|nr:hypothetical protein [Acidimicrobiaceae bacterium]
MTEYRIEHDSMGDVRVPVAAKYQAQTQRAVDNFPISGTPVEASLISALAQLKGAEALENARLGVLDEKVAALIAEVAGEIAAGEWHDQFPIDVFQTGSGTSTNMNMNEVIATIASERLASSASSASSSESGERGERGESGEREGEAKRVHPNDHVNASQSSNDNFPSAIHLAA